MHVELGVAAFAYRAWGMNSSGEPSGARFGSSEATRLNENLPSCILSVKVGSQRAGEHR
jgi:hypothetical protein